MIPLDKANARFFGAWSLRLAIVGVGKLMDELVEDMDARNPLTQDAEIICTFLDMIKAKAEELEKLCNE